MLSKECLANHLQRFLLGCILNFLHCARHSWHLFHSEQTLDPKAMWPHDTWTLNALQLHDIAQSAAGLLKSAAGKLKKDYLTTWTKIFQVIRSLELARILSCMWVCKCGISWILTQAVCKLTLTYCLCIQGADKIHISVFPKLTAGLGDLYLYLTAHVSVSFRHPLTEKNTC